MKQPRWLFWHRRDLRIRDNLALSQAVEKSLSLIGIYILDPKLINEGHNSPKLSEAQSWFLAESLIELQRNWIRCGSRLLILKGDPTKLIPLITKLINAEGVYWNKNIEPYECHRDKKIEAHIKKEGKKVISSWDHLIVEPDKIKTRNYLLYA